jgi:SAM-dependent methyltransferase
MDHALELTSRAEVNHFWFKGFRGFVVPVLASLAAGRSNLRLIDCGCGTGHNLALLAPHGRAIGLDLTFSGVVRAKARYPVAQADITCTPFRSGVFDVATSFDVLQCLPDDVAAVREMARLVKPGGTVLFTVPAFDALRGDHAISWNEFRRYTPGKVRALLSAAGVREERVSFMFGSIFPMVAAARVLQRLTRPLRGGVQGDIDIRVPAAPVNGLLTRVVEAEARLAQTLPMPIGSSILVVARKP